MASQTFLQSFIEQNYTKALNWLEFKHQQNLQSTNIYNSCDIRFAGFKMANVDCNLFPAGFKNLSPQGIANCQSQLLAFAKKHNLKQGSNLAIVAESHTRNIPYLHGVYIIKQIFDSCGFNAQLATFDLKKFKLDLNEARLEVGKLTKQDGIIYIDGDFKPDFLVINNDMTVQSPPLLDDTKIKTFPKTELGWHKRKKHDHFVKYQQIVNDFCKDFNLDPWLLSAFFDECGSVDVQEDEGLDCLSANVQRVIDKTIEKYKEYSLTLSPRVFVKANAGTYGMGVAMFEGADEVRHLNKKLRGKLDTVKAGTKSTSFLVQEAVPSIELIDGSSAELVCYGFNSVPCDFFYRYHAEKDSNNSLNAPGARFVNKGGFANPLDFKTNPLLASYFIVGSLAFLASGLE
jgi:glutamate--cysteine ligase